MPQLSLYIDQTTLEKVEAKAHQENLSISKWVVMNVLNKIEPSFPVGYEDLAGSIQDDSFERPKNLDWQFDSLREQL